MFEVKIFTLYPDLYPGPFKTGLYKKAQENKIWNLKVIDIRDYAELQKLGTIDNSFHIPRGLLEFSIHPESAYVQHNQIDLNKETVLFCAAGGRSALAAKTLKEMGFKNVSHVEGGFGLMVQKGFKIKS